MRPLLLLLAACGTSVTPPDTTPPACAWEGGGAHARLLAEGDWSPAGPEALARPGDLLLANGHAAFVIQGPDDPRTYYHYGGIPIDAVPMDGCAQAAPDTFAELGIVPARLELLDFPSSTMRQLRAETAEVISDGSDGGPAHVRVTGVDDRFWLVDLTLTRDEGSQGRLRPLSPPMGVRITVDYLLDPDDAALQIAVTSTNLVAADNPYLLGTIMFPAALTPIHVYAEGGLSFAGFSLDLDVPYMTLASAPTPEAPGTAYAIGVDTPRLAYADVSGARALLDADALLSDSRLAPAGQPGDARTDRVWLAVAAGDENAATQALHAVRPTFNGQPYALRRVTGAIEGAREPGVVEVQRDPDGDGVWRTLDRFAASPAFDVRLPDLPGLRLVARAGLSEPSPPVALADGDALDLALPVPDTGDLRVAVTDDGGPMPAKVSLYRDGARHHVLYVPPAGQTFTVPAGDWEVSVTRGYEYAPLHTSVTVPASGEVSLSPLLPRVVDTGGWVSVDGHIHSAPSLDSGVVPERRFATVAAAGLDVMVQTDHEAIVDLSAALDASPWAGTLRTVLGEEVTASSPEHMNMYGVEVRPEDGPRGNPVVWYGLDMGEIFAAMRARGAAVVQFNHPGYMTDVGYDPLTGATRLTDPALFGLRPDQRLWSWDFDAVELQNGFKYIFGDPAQPGGEGLFTAWQSFINLGHRVTGVGTSDVHGMETPGTPRTYVPGVDDLAGFVEGPMYQALLDGDALVSAGAFATVALGDDTAGLVAGMGDTFTVGDEPVRLRVRALALPEIRVDEAVVTVNCDVALRVPATDPTGVLKLDTTVDVPADVDANVVVVLVGSGPYPRGLEQPPPWVARAITNPIYLDVDGDGDFDPPGPKACDLTGLPRR